MSSIIDELCLFSDTLNLKINNEDVMMNANGMEGEMSATINTDDLEEYSADECEAGQFIIDQMFALKYIKIMFLFSKVSKWLIIKISNNRPFCSIYKMDNESYLRMYLAPKETD